MSRWKMFRRLVFDLIMIIAGRALLHRPSVNKPIAYQVLHLSALA